MNPDYCGNLHLNSDASKKLYSSPPTNAQLHNYSMSFPIKLSTTTAADPLQFFIANWHNVIELNIFFLPFFYVLVRLKCDWGGLR